MARKQEDWLAGEKQAGLHVGCVSGLSLRENVKVRSSQKGFFWRGLVNDLF